MKKSVLAFILTLIIVGLAICGIALGATYNIAWIGAIAGAFFSLSLGWAFYRFQDILDNENWKKSIRKHLRGKLIKPESLVRISFSYLFRIKVNSRYLLIKNHRGFEMFQPVGGVYKCDDTEKELLSSPKYCVADDNCIPIDQSSKNDYRMRLPVKHLKKFVKRFNTTIYRENFNDLSREFIEELIKPNILSLENFCEINYKVCGRYMTGLSYSTNYCCYELLLADIVELNLNENQCMELIALQNKPSDQYYWATEEEIETRGVKKGTENQKEYITNHSYKILDTRTQDLTDLKLSNPNYTVYIKEQTL